MSRITAFLRRTFGVVREHVGTDHLGNKYYSVPEQKTWTGRVVRAKRMVEASDPTAYQYLDSSIPSEWDAWIRGRRKQPPSLEELLRNERSREQIKENAKEVEERDRKLQAEEYQEGLVARPPKTLVKGHASTTSFGQQEVSQEPVITANTFQPGSWMPNAKK